MAKLRLGDLEKTLRGQSNAQAALDSGKMSFGDLLTAYRKRLEMDPEIKPSTKHYREVLLKTVLKSWPNFAKLDARKATEGMFKEWVIRYRARYSPTHFNNTLDTLRGVLNVAMELGVLYRNPINAIQRASVRTAKPELPDSETFLRFVHEIEQGRSRDSRNCADMVQFLAFGGFRLGEAKFITWADVDFTRGKIAVRGHPETGTKNREIREVPMIPDMRTLLDRLRAERPDEPHGTPVMRVFECQKAMNRAAAVIGMKRITHHDLRHLFATRCIESGVDVPTVSRWLGHKDGGALAMRVYGHLRDQHSVAMAQRVTFTKPTVTSVVKLKEEVA